MAQGFQRTTLGGSAHIAGIGLAMVLQARASGEHLIAETVTLAQQQQLLTVQIVGVQRLFRGERMVFGHKHHERFVIQGLGHHIRLDKRQRHDNHIQLTIAQLLTQVVGVAFFYIKRHFARQFLQMGNKLGQ